MSAPKVVTRPPSALLEWRTLIVASDLRSNARLVALVLSTHMDRNGGSCFPSITTLARETGLARSTVCVMLDQLERERLIDRVRGGRGKPTRYHATSPLTGLPVVRSPVVRSPVVRSPDVTSPLTGHEDVQEDVHKFSTRAGARAGKKRRRANAPTNDNIDPDLLAYDE